MAATTTAEVTWAAPGLPAEAPEVARIDMFPGVNMDPYSIRNGAVTSVRPYLQRATVPTCYKWVKVPGIRSTEALKVVDAFVKVHWWHLELTAPAELTPAMRRKAGIILGVSRAVMLANYDLKPAEFITGELVEGPMSATVAAGGAISYKISEAVITAANAEAGEAQAPPPAAAPEAGPAPPLTRAARARAFLVSDLELTAEEREVMRAIVRSAQAILPIQGYNLLTDGHHYLSAPDKASFRAFLAVENQMWVGTEAKAYLDGEKEFVRGIIWHKAGHPVDPELKKKMATDRRVASSLLAAGVGSAAARLPAVESELKPIQTYMKLTDAVKPSIVMYKGNVINAVFHDIDEALSIFPLGEETVMGPNNQPLTMTLGPYSEKMPAVTVRNREELKVFAENVIRRSQESVAVCYGYFNCMTEDQVMITGGAGASTLTKAFSLRKLKEACPSSYHLGYDFAKDYKAFRAKLRAEGDWAPPVLEFF